MTSWPTSCRISRAGEVGEALQPHLDLFSPLHFSLLPSAPLFCTVRAHIPLPLHTYFLCLEFLSHPICKSYSSFKTQLQGHLL